ncbi:MAG: hypothetical protein QOI63_1295 [Thermoplasmata archaeon]|jgi:hypothetical protein|nr:hypothetical protein [Thermoplasmata archaeon]
MAQVPAFSAFSAASELAVTAAVFYVLWRAWRHDDFRGALLAITLAFEACVNIAYMSIRLVSHAPALHASAAMDLLLAGHGVLSLLMFVGLVLLAAEAFRLHKQGRNALRERPRATLGFAILWSVSVLSGEAIFLLTLLR